MYSHGTLTSAIVPCRCLAFSISGRATWEPRGSTGVGTNATGFEYATGGPWAVEG